MLSQSKKHLQGVNESYFYHQRFALKYGLTCIQAGLMAIIHGFVPAFFESSASKKVQSLADMTRKPEES